MGKSKSFASLANDKQSITSASYCENFDHRSDGNTTMLEPATVVKIFQKQPDPQTLAAGQVIFAQGEAGDLMYGILQGEVELLVDGKAIETLKAGDVFGVGALVHLDGIRESSAIAKTDCQLAVLDRERFLFAVQETPLFALEVMRSYSNRLQRLKHSL
jgi:CRP-like cAMP-binding protein